MATIEISCCMDEHTWSHAKFFADSCLMLASGKHDIRFTTVLIGDAQATHPFEVVGSVPSGPTPNSSHGRCLGMVQEQASADYLVIADSDMVMTMKDWDAKCVDMIDAKEDIAAVGTAFGHTSVRYTDFPCLFFCMFDRSKLQSIYIDWMPVLGANKNPLEVQFSDPEFCKLYGTEPGKWQRLDVAWLLRYYFAAHGYRGIEIPHVYCNEDNMLMPFIDDDDRESSIKNFRWHSYEYHLNGDLFASHLVQGRWKRPEETDCFNWRMRANNYIRSKYGFGFRSVR